MAASADLTQDNSGSDFDNSDDLASLLEDDDDDIFAKKVFGNSPAKASVAKTKEDSFPKKSSENQFSQSSSKEIKPSKNLKDNYNNFGDDVLNEFLESNIKEKVSTDVKLTSPEKSKSKESSLQNDEVNLSLNHFSPTKDKRSRSASNSSVNLDDLNAKKSNSKPSEDRRGSYFDDFLQKLSPKHETSIPATPNIANDKMNDNDESDEDILGSYISSATKMNDNSSQCTQKSPKKRESLLKQVSFKDLSDDFLENDIPKSKTSHSPEKSKKKDNVSESIKNENPARIKRGERAKLNEDSDMNWLSYFSPKKTSKLQETKETNNNNLEETHSFAESKSKPVIKRQGSADWLGLSDSKKIDDNVTNDNELISSIKSDNDEKAALKSSKPKTVSASISRPQQQKISKMANKSEDIFMKNSNQSSTIDLSEILKDTHADLPDKKNKSSPVFKDSFKNENVDFVAKSRRNLQVNSNAQIISSDISPDNIISDIVSNKSHVFNDNFDKASRNLNECSEHFAALQSMQLMLDDSIKERQKLLKEYEAEKIALEEKLKASEELHKSEKKMLEDSFKIQESSLKQEYEIKFKYLEERLNFITEEKEKQAKTFEEKTQKLLKEHQLEIQRLKELHNQSVNIMKQDHEDALSRLKKLKEQEIEAILSTQVHSKSLQFLSDQLEARANELASLEKKIEERSQSTLHEKQLFLDTKEKELKALQNRLQKQLEDSEEEKTRLQQLVLRLESRLQKSTMESEEDHWETQQLKAKLTIQQKYLEEEQKLNQYQIEKEKEKLKIAQDSLLHEQKTILLQLAQERQQITQEKKDLQALAKMTKEEDAKLNARKLKEESSMEVERQYLYEERNKLQFEKEKVKQEFYQLERERDLLMKEKQQFKRDREILEDKEIDLKRKSSEIEERAATASQAQEKAKCEYAEALAIKKEQQHRIQQYSQQMQILMDKELNILSEREKLVAEKIEFEKIKNSVLCTKCRFSVDTPFQASINQSFTAPVVLPLPSNHGLSNQVHQSFMDPNLVIWHVAAQKDREFLQEELAYLKSLKEANKRKNSKQ